MRTVNVLSGTQNWYVALSQLDGFDTIVLLAVGSWQLAVSGKWIVANILASILPFYKEGVLAMLLS